MNREIKFRAWHNEFKEMIFSNNQAAYDKREFYPYCFCVGYSHYPENDWIIMQYTGIKDKNGKEIFEGDIWERNGFVATVEFEHCEWKFKRAESSRFYEYPPFWSNANTGVVIGNIFENPELLNKC